MSMTLTRKHLTLGTVWWVSMVATYNYDAVEIKRCYQCNGFNHTSKTCKSKEPSCPRCAESHLLKDCNAVELKCSNCAAFNRKNHNEDLNVDHAVWEYQKCISYQRMLEKIKQDVFVEVP